MRPAWGWLHRAGSTPHPPTMRKYIADLLAAFGVARQGFRRRLKRGAEESAVVTFDVTAQN